MNYLKIYNSLIERAKIRSLVEGYFEKHHIIPKSAGGSDESSNLVCLTAREHFICHYLLAKTYGGNMWHALIMMKGLKGRYINSKLYEFSRKNHSIEISKVMSSDRNPMRNETVRKTHREKVIEAMARPEVKMKQSLARIGMKFSDNHKKSLSESLKGRIIKKETCLNFSIAASKNMKKSGEREKRSIKLKEIMKDPDHRARISESMKKYWERKRNACVA